MGRRAGAGGLIYLGTSGFAADVLRRIADTQHRPSLVVTRPDRPAGRGRKLTAPPVKEAAEQLGLPVDQPDSVNDPDWVAATIDPEQDVVVCAFGALIKAPLLDREVFNVHPSLLPRWRGAAPVERAIMAGDTETGVSIMRIDAGLDSGPVALQERVPIAPKDDYATLGAKLSELSAQLLLRALDERPPWVDQPEDGITYAEKLGPDDRTLDPARPAQENLDVVRALRPHIGARIALPDGSYLGVHDAHVEDGRLVLDRVQPAGKTAMPYADYVRGRGGDAPW